MRGRDLYEFQDALWRRWKAGDEKAGADLLETLRPLIRSQMKGLPKSGVDRDDLHQVGYAAAVEAMIRYSPERGNLGALAISRIRGEMMRYCHDNSGPAKIPNSRPEKKLQYHLGAVVERWIELGHSEAVALDLAAVELDADPAHVRSAWQHRGTHVPTDAVRALELPETRDGPEVADDASRLLTELVAGLGPVQARIVRQRWLCDPEDRQTLDQLGAEIGVSRHVIAKQERYALERLREALEDRGLSLGDLV